MSVKNKAKDRDQHGRIKRKYTRSDDYFGSTPSWWTNLYMTRPKRRLTKRLCHSIKRGGDPDGIAFPVGSNRPHEYYW